MTATPDPVPSFVNSALLDNPIWHSLTTGHAHLAVGADQGHALARRYPADIGPLSAFAETCAASERPSAEAYADLATLVPSGDMAVLFLQHAPQPPEGWRLLRGGLLVQMVCPAAPARPSLSETILPLTPDDYPEMLALATLTEPGPFRANTASLGNFLGVRVGGRLAAMAGRRLAPNGFAEVSAVCTHPDFRGRGFAQALVAAVTRDIHAAGLVPFLSAFEANTGAVRIYQQVGFLHRRTLHLAALKPPSSLSA